ncbi:MAG: T9SS type A sorting domain-containing protein [Bacteroidia bacterium]
MININRLRQKTTQKQTWRRIFIISGFALLLYAGVFLVFTFSDNKEATASPANETLTTGSFIINMGVTPQTIGNGLKPYGMIREMIEDHFIPIKWVINPSKTKDGIDFTHNLIDYRGGTFIIPAEFITAAVAARITYWQTQGVIGAYSTSAITVPVYMTITNYPLVMVDVLSGNDSIIDNYYVNAGIPMTSYVKGSPADLDVCYDLWANPHGDPTWATHSNLHNFVTTYKSYIWSQCHAVSMMEDVVQPVSPFQQLNFLSTSGLKCYSKNKCGTFTEIHANSPTAPYTNFFPTDPVMQYIGTASGGMISSGSEKWFQPISTGAWRATTKRGVVTGTGTSPQEGVLLVYGPAYGDNNNGMVMYQGGHDLNTGAVEERVASQRAYHNFCLLAGKARELLFSSSTIPGTFLSNETFPVSVTVTSGVPAYTYQWTSSIGGTFANPNADSTTFTAPIVSGPTTGIIRCIVTDACGRVNFFAQTVNFNTNPLPVTLLEFTAKSFNNNKVIVNWITASETNNDFFTVERSAEGKEFTLLTKVKGAGNSSSENKYSFTDHSPLNGNSYYRLKQTDYDGKTEIFNPVAVKINRQIIKDLTIYPNPFNTSFVAEFISDDAEDVWIQVLNINGALIHSEKTLAAKGPNTFKFNAPGELAEGTYVFKLKNNKEILATERLILNK